MNAQATQMESLAPRPCEDCKGTGTVIVRGCGHQGNCPCGEDREFPCSRCRGTGRELCDWCGESPAEIQSPAPELDALCWTCESVRAGREIEERGHAA